jgi:5-formyltetrahydrofolate cyclo-ligase
MIKSEIRRRSLSLRDSMSPEKKKSADKKIFNYITQSSQYSDAEKILIFVTMGSEIDTLPVIGDALSRGKTVAVPFCDGSDLRFRVIDSLDCLSVDKRGIPTAKSGCPYLTDFSSSLCIVPALTVDRKGYRIGYGGGYYDRFLAENTETEAVAVCYGDSVCNCLPTDKWDVPVNTIITEGGAVHA